MASALLAACAASACVDDASVGHVAGRPSKTEASSTGWVAKVAGQPVSLRAVRSRVQQAVGQSQRAALRKALRQAEDFELLALEAEARGFGHSAMVRRGVRQAQVRALLGREVERGQGPALRREAVHARRLRALLRAARRRYPVTLHADGLALVRSWDVRGMGDGP